MPGMSSSEWMVPMNRTWFRWDGKLMTDWTTVRQLKYGLWTYGWASVPVRRQLIHKGRKP